MRSLCDCIPVAEEVAEPAWHRNDRKKRHRARRLVSAAVAGRQVIDIKLTAAKTLLLGHHATRGAAREAMGHGKNGKGSHTRRTPWANDWRCPGCSVPGYPVFSIGKYDRCKDCNTAKPTNPCLYSSTQEYKDSQSGAGKSTKGKGGGKSGGPKCGADNELAKKVRALQKEKDDEWNRREIQRLEAEKRKEKWGQDADE